MKAKLKEPELKHFNFMEEKSKLTDVQRKMYDSISWLFSDSETMRGTGRTYLMAIFFIEKALSYPNKEIDIFDHVHYARSAQFLLKVIQGILKDTNVNMEYQDNITHPIIKYIGRK